MTTADKIIFRASLLILALCLIVLIVSILAKPFSDGYLRGWGIAAIVALIPTLYGTFRLLQDRRKKN